jgi:hypothetical protein
MTVPILYYLSERKNHEKPVIETIEPPLESVMTSTN